MFGDRLLLDYDDRPLAHDASERNAKAEAFVPDDELLRRYDCVHGHFLPAKYAKKRMPCRFAVWLRDPVQRVMSRFLFAQRQGRGEVARMTLAEFCQAERYHNLYAQYLWNFEVEGFDFVGITEDYVHSVHVFRHRFGLWPGADAARVAAWNANPGKAVSRAYEVDGGVRRIIERANAQDLEIYEQGKRHLAMALSRTPARIL